MTVVLSVCEVMSLVEIKKYEETNVLLVLLHTDVSLKPSTLMETIKRTSTMFACLTKKKIFLVEENNCTVQYIFLSFIAVSLTRQ